MENETAVGRAIDFATKAHEGQMRKGEKRTPYITHPLAVKRILECVDVTDPWIISAAVLHDVVEDCGVSRETLVGLFGIGIANIVMEVTDDPALDTKEARKKAQVDRAPTMSWSAKMVKIADKIANMRDIEENPPGWDRETIRAYVSSAMRVVMAMGQVHPDLELMFYKTAVHVGQFHQH